MVLRIFMYLDIFYVRLSIYCTSHKLTYIHIFGYSIADFTKTCIKIVKRFIIELFSNNICIASIFNVYQTKLMNLRYLVNCEI